MSDCKRTITLIAIPLAILVLALVFATCRRSPAEQAPEDPPRAPGQPRLAVLSPAISATLLRMGLEDLVVARHAYDLALDRSIPSVGDERALDAETLIRAAPTHVLIDAVSRESLAHAQQLADRFGWEVHAFDLLTLDDIARSARQLQELFAPDDPDAQRAIDEFQRAIAPRDLAFDGRLLLLAQTDPISAIGPPSFHGEILDRFAIANAIADHDRWVELDAEDVVRLAPDAIILIRWRSPGDIDEPSPSDEDVRAALGALADLDLPAIRDGHIAMIDDPLALIPSLAIGRFATRLEEILETFED